MRLTIVHQRIVYAWLQESATMNGDLGKFTSGTFCPYGRNSTSIHVRHTHRHMRFLSALGRVILPYRFIRLTEHVLRGFFDGIF